MRNDQFLHPNPTLPTSGGPLISCGWRFPPASEEDPPAVGPSPPAVGPTYSECRRPLAGGRIGGWACCTTLMIEHIGIHLLGPSGDGSRANRAGVWPAQSPQYCLRLFGAKHLSMQRCYASNDHSFIPAPRRRNEAPPFVALTTARSSERVVLCC